MKEKNITEEFSSKKLEKRMSFNPHFLCSVLVLIIDSTSLQLQLKNLSFLF